MLKKCGKCSSLVSKPDASYCHRHAGKNPKLSKEYERALIEYCKKRFPSILEQPLDQPDGPLRVNSVTKHAD